jgi:acyl carrier protein
LKAILLRHPDIKEAIVTVLQDSEKDKTLVSYVVLKESVQPVSENLKSLQIKEHIQKFLPEYMVPNIIMFLEKLPLTLNGKIDKHALSKLNYVSSSNTRVPRNQIEQDIRQIWSKILRLPVSKIGIQDDFFRLGGDSIDGIELVILLRQELGLNLTIRDIFNYKTIEKLYDYVEDNQLYVKATSSIKHEEGTLSGNVPFLPIQKLFFASNFAAPHHWNQSFLLKVNHLEIKKLERCIYELIKHHDNFRLRYKTENKSILNHLKNNSHEYTQYYDSEAKPEKLKVLDIRSLRYKEGTKDFDDLLQSILTGWQGNFNLEQGPTYSIGYIYGYADGSARIHFAFHHLIIDTVSWRILTNDLENLYNDKKLEVKTSSYRQWVKAVRDYAKDNKRERAYWQKVLSDYSPDSLTPSSLRIKTI